MIRLIALVILCSLSLISHSQKSLRELIPKRGKQVDSFIPKGWVKLHTAFGDFNDDGKKDVAVVLIDSIKEYIINDVNRSLIILKKTISGFELSGYCDSAFLCMGCGGVHGDPYQSLEFKKNQLVIRHFGGSSWRWELTSKFRYQDSDWFLIGETHKSYHILTFCSKLDQYGGLMLNDINYLTGEYKEMRNDETSCELIKNSKTKKARRPLVKLADYNITSIWNITQ